MSHKPREKTLLRKIKELESKLGYTTRKYLATRAEIQTLYFEEIEDDEGETNESN